MMVPIAFRVPSEDASCPKATWGFALGKHAAKLRKMWREGGRKIDPTQQKELDEMPFAWDWTQYKWNHYFLPGLRRFYDLNGHADVPRSFRGILNGQNIYGDIIWVIGSLFAKQVTRDAQELKRLGFCFESTIHDRNWNEKVILALKVFRQVFGHCNVDQAFVVPSISPWPKKAWGMRLGKFVSRIRIQHQRPNRDKMNWTSWDLYGTITTQNGVSASCLRRKHFIELMITVEYHFLSLCHLMRLGQNSVGGTYSTQVSRDRSRLEALGFVSGNY
ncbi:hypothetical protein PHMEG_00028690 [Phytophthora megakarya]|uniref:Helicase-associated domain-containing protein n=1 Tax=Phytophthora megakarya TaxID=4795 RepID=A0A225V4E0_9STRA|nr:hypothetical protein PHMEG_00028690 [Phytophthora megakarya]